jgi:RNA polymerase sigma factor (sigma-70 family)
MPTQSANGDFETFVREHCSRLVQTLSLIVLDRELASDAAQDAFLKLYLRWDTVDELQDPVAWVYKVALNRCMDYRRRIARRVRLLERLQADYYQPNGWATPEAHSSELVEMFKSLPQGQRTAATLYYLADFPTQEIAQVMNVSKGTVDRHLYRARQALRETVRETAEVY